MITHIKGKGTAIPLQAWTSPEGSRRLLLPDFKTIGTWRWYSCQPYAPATFTPKKNSWYSFLFETESTRGPRCGQKDYVNEKFHWHHRESNPWPSGLQHSASTNCTTVCPMITHILTKNEVTNTLMPETLFWLQYIQGTWAADGTYQTST